MAKQAMKKPEAIKTIKTNIDGDGNLESASVEIDPKAD